MRTGPLPAVLLAALLMAPAGAAAQTVESVGSRALGMGGAFVAVASDSSATWWNPAGLAAGPFVDMALTRAVTTIGADQGPLGRSRVSSFALGTPVVGLSFYRFRTTDAPPVPTTAMTGADRQGNRAEGPVRSLAASQLGLTLVQSVASGIHLGATFKYLRGRVRTGVGQGTADDVLDAGESLDGGSTGGRFDLDAGVMAVSGPVRVGAVVRNVREVGFDTGAGDATRSLPRQVRVGAAFDGDSARLIPLTIAVDGDLRRYRSATGDRRVIAVGAEQWLWSHRLGIRAGGRFNTVGAEERAATAGISVAVRPGLFLDGHIVGGGAVDERGWGAAARVSF